MSELRGPGDFYPQGEFVVDRYYDSSFNGFFDGRFYQPATPEECYIRREAIKAALLPEADFGALPVETFQRWAELDWKKPHGSFEMVDRLYDKLTEEGIHEAPAEFKPLWPRSDNRLDAVPSMDKLLEELGDILWVTTALTSNAGINLRDALVEYIHQRPLLSSHFEISFQTVDKFVMDGYVPHIGPIDTEDIGTATFDYDEMNPMSNLLWRVARLRHWCLRQYGYGEEAISYYTFRKLGHQEVGPAAADMVILIAYYAHQWGRASLAEVAKRNVIKLTARTAHNLVDKLDGPRQG